jgi:drug/metabolite transporter (DMT)-like permease
MKIAYLQIILTLLLTVYGQIILKFRVISHGSLPSTFIGKTKFLFSLFLDPYIFSGFLAAFFASLLWMSAMTKLPLTRAYPIMAAAPALVLIFSIIFLSENLTFGKILGSILILTGAYISIKF